MIEHIFALIGAVTILNMVLLSVVLTAVSDRMKDDAEGRKGNKK